VAKGIKVVGFNTVLGPDLAKMDPQIQGVPASIVYTAYDRGQHLGKLLEQACAGVSGDCQVGYMYNFKASGFNRGIRSGFDNTISADTNIRVVAEADDSFTATGGLAAAQTMLQAHPDINVFVGSDQGSRARCRRCQRFTRPGRSRSSAWGWERRGPGACEGRNVVRRESDPAGDPGSGRHTVGLPQGR
jgi:hypothetical protein